MIAEACARLSSVSPPLAAIIQGCCAPSPSHRLSSSTLLSHLEVAIAASELRTAAEGCEGDTVGRLSAATSATSDGLNSAVSTTIDAVLHTLSDARAKAKKQLASREKHLESQFEELNANKAVLVASERQLCVQSNGLLDLDAIEDSMNTAGRLSMEWDPSPIRTSVTTPGNGLLTRGARALSDLAGMSHMQMGVDAARSVVMHPSWLERGEVCKISVQCRDAIGDEVKGVRTDDVCVSFAEGAAGWSVSDVAVEGGALSMSVALTEDAVTQVALIVDISLCRIEITLQVGWAE